MYRLVMTHQMVQDPSSWVLILSLVFSFYLLIQLTLPG